MSESYGAATCALVNRVFSSNVNRGVLFMRHSAREFNRDINDLLNPLTDEGRALSQQFGSALPKSIALKGYASPVERCIETAELIVGAHMAEGGAGGRTRAVEGFGVFYALDQRKMWKTLQSADSLADYVLRWFANEVPADALIPATQAADLLVRQMVGKLRSPGAERQLDVCVSHDMSVFMLRHGVGLEPADGPDVKFLDGLLLFEQDGELFMASQHGGQVALGEVAN